MTEDNKAAQEAQDEATKELAGRTEQFNKELIPLLGKYELGLGASAFINANGTIGARPILFDDRKKKEPEAAPAEPAIAAPAIAEA